MVMNKQKVPWLMTDRGEDIFAADAREGLDRFSTDPLTDKVILILSLWTKEKPNHFQAAEVKNVLEDTPKFSALKSGPLIRDVLTGKSPVIGARLEKRTNLEILKTEHQITLTSCLSLRS
jgi:hypothetical protein